MGVQIPRGMWQIFWGEMGRRNVTYMEKAAPYKNISTTRPFTKLLRDFVVVLLFVLFKIPADCRRFNLRRPTGQNYIFEYLYSPAHADSNKWNKAAQQP